MRNACTHSNVKEIVLLFCACIATCLMIGGVAGVCTWKLFHIQPEMPATRGDK